MAPHARPIFIEWQCGKCGRRGIATVLPDEPTYPHVRAYRAHKEQQLGRRADADPPRCEHPSLTWRRRIDEVLS